LLTIVGFPTPVLTLSLSIGQTKRKNRPGKIRRWKFNKLHLTYQYSNFKTGTIEGRSRIVSYRTKTSTKWYRSALDFPGTYVLPYIDQYGRITNYKTYSWKIDFRIYISSIISTVLDRVKSYWRRKKSKAFVREFRKELVIFSTIYSLTRDNHYFSRMNFLLRRRMRRDISAFSTCFVKKLGIDTKVIITHALKQAMWLSSSSNRNIAWIPRDQLYKRGKRRFPILGKIGLLHPYIKYDEYVVMSNYINSNITQFCDKDNLPLPSVIQKLMQENRQRVDSLTPVKSKVVVAGSNNGI